MENGGSTSSSSGLSSSSLQASMQEFKLFETQLNFYMIGWNGNGVYRVLKLDRIDTSDLNITDIISVRMPPPIPEKNATSCLNGYTKATRPHAASNWSLSVMASLGSLSFWDHTPCWLLPREERYAKFVVTWSMKCPRVRSFLCVILACFPTLQIQETRTYKKLMCMVDLTNDFFFSYSFNIMRSFQKNLCNHESGATLYKKMFVWNEFLTRGIRHQLWNTAWTVALVYGFFKQVQLYFLLLTAKE
ncbi:unnamed protein product [Brassica oleracea var. botrytis]|uniref:phosphoinositide phosphatase SAC4-like isoform X3 n=1 Tax=Brassica napus TaxID=3708 RepID=UPI0006AAC780|nr:phosphoinositide phosphatase SAC4-like isoform X3 [Brassica napus]